MASRVRRFVAIFAVVSLAAAGAAFAQACGSSNAVPLPSGPDGSTSNEEASADAPVAETGGDSTAMDAGASDGSPDGGAGDGGGGDSGEAASDAPADAASDGATTTDS